MTILEFLELTVLCLIGAGAMLYLIGTALVRYSSADEPEAK